MKEDPVMTHAEEIASAHPINTKRHDLYAHALMLVGERHDKGDLVDLVCWLLYERAQRDERIEKLEAAVGVMVPTCLRSLLQILPPDADVDRQLTQGVLDRVNEVMRK